MSQQPIKITVDEAVALLDVHEPRVVAWTSKNGKLRDDDGDEIDPRKTVPWTWALGPFGSWQSTIADAADDIRKALTLYLAHSWLHDDVIVIRDGWGFKADKNRAAEFRKSREVTP